MKTADRYFEILKRVILLCVVFLIYPGIAPADGCRSGTAVFELNEAVGSAAVTDEAGVITGVVNNPAAAFTGDGFYHGDGASTCINFKNNFSDLISTSSLTIEARVKPTGLAGTAAYIKRILSRDWDGNYQLSVWRNNAWDTYEAPSGEASIAFWVKPEDAHGGDAWKPVLSNYATCPIVSDHWYTVRVTWDSARQGVIPGDIFIEDQGTDGAGTGANWSGFANCTDSAQTLVPASKHLSEGDRIRAADGVFSIGCDVAKNTNNVFSGLIDRIRVDAEPVCNSGKIINSCDLILSDIYSLGGSLFALDPVPDPVTGYGTLRLIATGSPMKHPEGMAVASDGRIFVADWWAWDTVANATSGPRGVYAINPDGSVTTIREGDPFVTPTGLVFGDNGDLIVIDHGTNEAQGRVYRMNAVTGEILASNTHANMYNPQGIVKDKNTGDVYIADHNGVFHLDQDTFALVKVGSFTGLLLQDLVVTGDGKLLIAGLNGQIVLLNPATGGGSVIFDDDIAGDVVPSGSSFDGIEWIDGDTFAVVNKSTEGDVFAFDYDQAAGTITHVDVRYYDGQLNGGQLIIPLGIEKYAVDRDSDGIEDCIDPDDDNDGISDSYERTCGSDPENSSSTCEICDGLDNDLNDGIDEGFADLDGDGMADCADQCDNSSLNHPTTGLRTVPATCVACHADGVTTRLNVGIDVACGSCHGGGPDINHPAEPSYSGKAPYKTTAILSAVSKNMHGCNAKPVVGSSYTITGDRGMTVTILDSSTDADGTLGAVKIDWGDGTIATGVRGESFTHTYVRAQTYTVFHSVTDGMLSDNEAFKVTVPKTISISGAVSGIGGGNGGVTLILKYGGRTKQSVKTNTDGSFTFTKVRPVTSGEYSIVAYKYHVNFSPRTTSLGAPTADVTGVGIAGTAW